MNMRDGWVVSIAAVSLLLATVFVSANPLKDPKRIISGQTVDLTTLFEWFPKQKDDQPLSKWMHVTGEIVGTNAWGWVLTAHISGTDPQNGEKKTQESKVILRNPPLHDRHAFDTLLAQKKALEQQRADLSSQADTAAGHVEQISDQRKANKRAGVPSRGLNAQSSKWKQEEKNAKTSMKPIDRQLQELETQFKGYPARDHYVVDCFALSLAEKVNGLPLYDYGIPLR